MDQKPFSLQSRFIVPSSSSSSVQSSVVSVPGGIIQHSQQHTPQSTMMSIKPEPVVVPMVDTTELTGDIHLLSS